MPPVRSTRRNRLSAQATEEHLTAAAEHAPIDPRSRRGGKQVHHRPGHVVGYAVLGPDARASGAAGTFLRRVFWLAPHDRDQAPGGASMNPARPPKPSTTHHPPGREGR